VRPRERQRNERHESDAADPVGDEHDMQMRGILHGNVYDWFVPVERGHKRLEIGSGASVPA
jgi:hypothetical protein